MLQHLTMMSFSCYSLKQYSNHKPNEADAKIFFLENLVQNKMLEGQKQMFAMKQNLFREMYSRPLNQSK